VTSPGPSPPRSKKESSDAGELTPVAAVPQTVLRAVPPQDVVDRAAERRLARDARREAKQRARSKRLAARQAVAEAAAAKAGAVDAEAVEVREEAQVHEEAQVPEEAQVQEDAMVQEEAQSPEPFVREEPADDLVADEPRPAAPPTPPLAEVLAQAGIFERPTAAEPAPERPPQHAARSSRLTDRRAPGRRSRGSARAAEDDGIVEPPREPKVPLARRLRSLGARRSTVDSTGRRGGSRRGVKRLVSAIAGLVGAIGLICSVVLAFGALLVALDATDGSVYDSVSGVCDVLVGPLRDAFSFSGSNAEMKEALVAWGAGAIAYLVVGVVAQSLLRSTVDG
jgi:hypothetical protein